MSYWMVAGALVSAYGSMQAGKAKRAEARLQAFQLEEQKKDAKIQSMQEHNMRLANLKSVIGINTSLAGVMGRDSGSDRSLAKVQEKFKNEARVEEDRARLDYLKQQNQRTLGIQLANMRGKNAMRAARINTATSLLKAGYQYSQVT